MDEPALPALAIAPRQRELGMIMPREQPGRGIAEALATIFAPPAGTGGAVTRIEIPLAPLGGPPQLTTGAAGELRCQQFLPRTSQRVAQPHPGEVEKLVDEDAGQFAGLAPEFGVERNASLPQEGASMNLAASVT